MSETIHVCYVLYDKTGCFSKFVGTSISSLFKNTSAAVTVHLVCFGEISHENLLLNEGGIEVDGNAIINQL